LKLTTKTEKQQQGYFFESHWNVLCQRRVSCTWIPTLRRSWLQSFPVV